MKIYIKYTSHHTTKLTLLQYSLIISIAFLLPTILYNDIISYFVYILTTLFFIYESIYYVYFTLFKYLAY
jgi:hypothetical protein